MTFVSPTRHNYMPSLTSSRLAILATLAFSGSLLAQQQPPQQVKPSAASPPQSTLPASQPTTTPPSPDIPLTPAQLPPKRAQIDYVDGKLSVSADNSSLNQILRQISGSTGLKITGGVADERVFGKYGPASTAQVLAALLAGTGSNMVLSHRDPDFPAELILTPRQGGPTPPSPNASVFDDKAEQPTSAAQPEQPTPTPSFVPATPQLSEGSTGATQPSPDSPNGTKTPQQIYEQLQRMRQQQQQTTSPQ
jgi:hypothetical protein